MQKELNIHQRINGIMSDLDYVAKGDKTVNGQYRFVSHDQVTAKIHPLLVKWGVNIIPCMEEMTQDGNRTTVKLAICFVNTDNPDDRFLSVWFSHGIDSGDKGIGKAISYAYKYALLKTFNLETGDDPDNDAETQYEAPKCVEFDGLLPDDLSKEHLAQLDLFLKHISETTQKHVEDIKREATKRMPEFLKAFKKWNNKTTS